MLGFRHREQPFEKREEHWQKICGIPTTHLKNDYPNAKNSLFIEGNQLFFTSRFLKLGGNTIDYDYRSKDIPCLMFRLELNPN